jgi:hypothetical protein
VVACETTQTTYKFTVIAMEHDAMFEREVAYHEALKQRNDNFKGVDMPWKDYFHRLKKAFYESQIAVDKQGAELRVTTFFHTRPVVLKFELLPVDAEFVRSKMAAVLLQAVDRISTAFYALDTEVHRLRRALDTQNADLTRSPGTSTASSTSTLVPTVPFDNDVAAAAASAHATTSRHVPKRRAGFSIVNPSAKRKLMPEIPH